MVAEGENHLVRIIVQVRVARGAGRQFAFKESGDFGGVTFPLFQDGQPRTHPAVAAQVLVAVVAVRGWRIAVE